MQFPDNGLLIAVQISVAVLVVVATLAFKVTVWSRRHRRARRGGLIQNIRFLERRW